MNLGEKRWMNFRTPGRKTPKGKPSAAKRPGMSEAHLAAIRQLPCCVSGRRNRVQAHHLKDGTGERGMGMRSTDRWAVPLDASEHEHLERQGSRNEAAWFSARGIADPLHLATALWAASPDLKRMEAIILEHRGMP